MSSFETEYRLFAEEIIAIRKQLRRLKYGQYGQGGDGKKSAEFRSSRTVEEPARLAPLVLEKDQAVGAATLLGRLVEEDAFIFAKTSI